MKKYIFAIFFAAAFLISSCKSENLPTPTYSPPSSISIPTSTPTKNPQSTRTQKITSLTSYSTSTPTLYSIPSITPSATITPTPTPALHPSFTPTIIPTVFDFKTTFPQSCGDDLYSAKVSPDGMWVAEYCFFEDKIQVSNQDGTTVYVVKDGDFYTPPEDFPNQSVDMSPMHWTQDSQYVYIILHPDGGCGTCRRYLASYEKLIRVKISDGTSSVILSGFFHHAFSPTDRRLIEIEELDEAVKIHIHDISTGETETFIPDNNKKIDQAGDTVWSPDGRNFVFTAGYGGCEEPFSLSFILVGVDPHWQKALLKDMEGFIDEVYWEDNDIVKFIFRDGWEDTSKIIFYEYNISSETLTILNE